MSHFTLILIEVRVLQDFTTCMASGHLDFYNCKWHDENGQLCCVVFFLFLFSFFRFLTFKT